MLNIMRLRNEIGGLHRDNTVLESQLDTVMEQVGAGAQLHVCTAAAAAAEAAACCSYLASWALGTGIVQHARRHLLQHPLLPARHAAIQPP